MRWSRPFGQPTGIVPAGPALDFDAPVDRTVGVDKLIVF
jgi:hypothetical protein